MTNSSSHTWDFEAKMCNCPEANDLSITIFPLPRCWCVTGNWFPFTHVTVAYEHSLAVLNYDHTFGSHSTVFALCDDTDGQTCHIHPSTTIITISVPIMIWIFRTFTSVTASTILTLLWKQLFYSTQTFFCLWCHYVLHLVQGCREVASEGG